MVRANSPRPCKTHQVAIIRQENINWLTHQTVTRFRPLIGSPSRDPFIAPLTHPNIRRTAPMSCSSLAEYLSSDETDGAIPLPCPFPFKEAYTCCCDGRIPDSETNKGRPKDVARLTSAWKKRALAPERTASASTAPGTEF